LEDLVTLANAPILGLLGVMIIILGIIAQQLSANNQKNIESADTQTQLTISNQAERITILEARLQDTTDRLTTYIEKAVRAEYIAELAEREKHMLQNTLIKAEADKLLLQNQVTALQTHIATLEELVTKCTNNSGGQAQNAV
jgi:DNA replication protein DnaD